MEITSKIADSGRTVYGFFLRMICRISPELNTKVYYRLSQGKKLNLEHPTDFNEKLMWLKLNSYKDDPLVYQCADKYRVREYVERKGFSDNLTKLLFVYDNVDDIEWNRLPDKFALKLNYGCGFNIICRDKEKLDIIAAKKRIKSWMKKEYYLTHSELQYKDVKKKILVEEFIETGTELAPPDYKFYCFDGVPKCILYCYERIGGHAHKAFYDIDGNLLSFKIDCENVPFVKPKSYGQMLEMCRALSNGFPFVRVDLYDGGEHPIFGELTFSPAGGTGDYTEEGSRLLGSWINI